MSLIDSIQKQDEERRKKFKAEQKAFEEETARRMVATGQGIASKDNLQYTNTREGHRFAEAAERIGLHAGDVRKEATKEAELKNQARNELLSERSSGSLTVGQRDSKTNKRTLSVSGTRPAEPTQDEINSKVGDIVRRDPSINKHLADKYAQKSTQYGISIVGQPTQNKPVGEVHDWNYYKNQFADSQKRAAERETATSPFSVDKPAILPYDPFEYITSEGKVTDKDHAVDVRIKSQFAPYGTFTKKQTDDGTEFYFQPNENLAKIVYPTRTTYDLTDKERSKLGWEALNNLTNRGESISQDKIALEIDSLLGSKYKVGDNGYSVPTSPSEKEQRDQTNLRYAAFKIDQIIQAGEKGELSAYTLNDNDLSGLKGNYDSQLKAGMITPEEHGQAYESLKALRDLPNQIMGYQAENKRIRLENAKNNQQRELEIMGIKSRAAFIGYSAQPTYDQSGEIDGFNFVPRKGSGQFTVKDDKGSDITQSWLEGGDFKSTYFNPIPGQQSIRGAYAPEKTNIPGIGTEFTRGFSYQAGSDVADLIGQPKPLTALDELMSIPAGSNPPKYKSRADALRASQLGQTGQSGNYTNPGRGKGISNPTDESIGGIEWKRKDVFGAIGDNPERFLGEIAFEGALGVVGGEVVEGAGKVGLKAIRFGNAIRKGEKAIDFTGLRIEPPKTGTNPKGIDLGEAPKTSKLIDNLTTAKRLYKTGGLDSLVKGLELKVELPKIKVRDVKPTQHGVQTELGGEATTSTEEVSTGGVLGSQTSEPVTSDLLNPASNAQKVSNDLQFGDTVAPSKTTNDILLDMAKSGELGKPAKIRAKGKELFVEVTSKSGKAKNDILKDLKAQGKNLKGKAKSAALGARQTALEGLQALDKKVNPLKKIGAKGFNPYQYGKVDQPGFSVDRAYKRSDQILQLEKPQPTKGAPFKQRKVKEPTVGLFAEGKPESATVNPFYSDESFGYAKPKRRSKNESATIDFTNIAVPPAYREDHGRKPVFIVEPGSNGESGLLDGLNDLIGIPTVPKKPNKVKEIPTSVPTFNTDIFKTTGGSPHRVDTTKLDTKTGTIFDTDFKFKDILDVGTKQPGRSVNKVPDDPFRTRLKAPPIILPFGGGFGIASGSGKRSGKSSTRKHSVENPFAPLLSIQGEEKLGGFSSKGNSDPFGIFGKRKRKGRRKRDFFSIGGL